MAGFAGHLFPAFFKAGEFGVILLAQDFSPKSSGLTGSSCGLLVFRVGPFEVFDGSVLEVPDTGGDFID